MANFIVTPNMNLPNPVPGVDPGPDYADNLQSSLNVLDQHNHAPGSGVQITPAGININSTLAFNNNPATGLAYVNITTQGGSVPAPVNYSAYFSGLEFFVKDGAGNAVQITTGGAVNATSSGISSGTNTASFVGSTLVVNANTNTPANIQAASILLGNNIVSSNYVTLSPVNSLGSSYSLVLPLLPAANGTFVQLDTSGNFSATTTVDNSTLEVSSNSLRVKPGGITNTQIASFTISGGNIALGTIVGANLVSNIALPGTGVTIGGQKAILATESASSPNKVIFGFLASGGGSSAAGYTQVRNSLGNYTVTFSAGNLFGDTPSVTLTGISTGGFTIFCQLASTPSTTGFSYLTYGNSTTALADANVNFMAIGVN